MPCRGIVQFYDTRPSSGILNAHRDLPSTIQATYACTRTVSPQAPSDSRAALWDLSPAPFIQPEPVAKDVFLQDTVHAFGQPLILPQPGKVYDGLRVGKHLGVKQARRLGAEEPVVIAEQARQRFKGRSGVGEELLRVDVWPARRLENLGHSRGAERVRGRRAKNGVGWEVPACQQVMVSRLNIDGKKLCQLVKGFLNAGGFENLPKLAESSETRWRAMRRIEMTKRRAWRIGSDPRHSAQSCCQSRAHRVSGPTRQAGETATPRREKHGCWTARFRRRRRRCVGMPGHDEPCG